MVRMEKNCKEENRECSTNGLESYSRIFDLPKEEWEQFLSDKYGEDFMEHRKKVVI